MVNCYFSQIFTVEWNGVRGGQDQPQSVTDWLLILYLRQEYDHKDDGECPGGEEPEYRELSPDSGVVLHYGKHVEPLY